MIISDLTLLSQSPDQFQITELIAGGGHNFLISGDDSEKIIDSLFSNLPATKRKGYVFKFKKLHIPGIDQSLTFQVHQGITGSEENGQGYFNTFGSEKYKNERLASKKDTEKPAIIIYVKRGRNHFLKTEEEVKIVKDYLLSIYN